MSLMLFHRSQGTANETEIWLHMSIFQVYTTFYILDYGSNTQAIVTNACTCYLVIQLFTLQLKLDILGVNYFHIS